MIQIHKKALISTILTIIGSILSIYVIIELFCFLTQLIDFRLLLAYLIVSIPVFTYFIVILALIYTLISELYDYFVNYYKEKERIEE
jgi:hypothetical protein